MRSFLIGSSLDWLNLRPRLRHCALTTSGLSNLTWRPRKANKNQNVQTTNVEFQTVDKTESQTVKVTERTRSFSTRCGHVNMICGSQNVGVPKFVRSFVCVWCMYAEEQTNITS